MKEGRILEDFNEENQRKFNKGQFITTTLSIVLALVIAGVILMAAWVVIIPDVAPGLTSTQFTQEQLERLEKAAKIIEDNYLYEYDMDKIVDGAIGGMVESLDNPFTYYQDEEAYQEDLHSGANANYVGIGVHLTYDVESDAIMILGTMNGSPAEEVNIKSGDVIVKVDDTVVNAETYNDAVDQIKGEEGTSVKLTILRGEEKLEFVVPRRSISENNVVSEVLDNNIGYIRVFAFDNGVYDQFKTEYYKLREQNIKGLVIDLRNNPGGYVDQTAKMLNLLVPKCEAIRIVEKNGDEDVISTDDKEQIDIPLAVIVNQNSASASEIFASVVRDMKKGEIVGTTTYGKGVVQYVKPIKGHGAISIVSAQYFTPSNVVIQDKGIEPDHVVELSDELKNNMYVDREKDLQLQKAIEIVTK